MAADLGTLLSNLRLEANIPPPADLRNVREGYSSVYVFDIRPPAAGGALVFRYDVELTELGKNKSLTRGGSDDGKKGLLRNICYELIGKIAESSQGFGVEASFVYDNRKILFTNKPINDMIVEITPDQMTKLTRDYLRGSTVKIEIKPCQTERHQLDLNDLNSALSSRPEESTDRSVRTFLEMLTSQSFINAGTHDIVGMGRLFERTIVKELEDGIVTRNGLAKGVRIIDNNGNPKPALVADVKTCAFFANQSLEEIFMQMINKRRIDINRKEQMERFAAEFNQLFRGVSGFLTYSPSRIIVIDSITQRSMSELSFDVDGRSMSMVEFFEKKKNVKVNGRLPAVRQQQDRETLFPLSCIIVLPNQRVTIDKMSDFISRELLNANTTQPNHRYSAIESEVRKIGTGNSMSFMGQFGVRLIGGKNNISIGRHELPKVKFGGNETLSFQDKIHPAVKFYEPTNVLKKWVVACPRQVSEQDAREFVNNLLRMGRNKGMQIPNPQFECIELDSLAARMEALHRDNVQFLMYIDRKFVKSHSVLKLNEKRYGILTQHVTAEVAGKARPMTLSNVLNKMNMKLFGYNYMPILPQIAKKNFNLETGDVLVIGVDTSRPPKATAFEKYMMSKRGMADLQSEEPMIVGICANYLANPFKFCGDYYYQPCKQDVLEPNGLLYKIGWILDKVKKFRKKAPSVVFIIRDGVSEGMIPNNMRDEFPSYINACKAFDRDWKPKFVYCIVDKKHNKRFFLKGSGDQQVENTVPGCVIDSKVTRVDIHEFWMQSHVPLKGTAKIPQYVFPVNEVNANNNELQSFLLTLCNSWQIVTLAPALPTPVRQASELAKRGRNNYIEMKRNAPQFIPRVAGTNQIDYQQLNNRLCYNGQLFSDTRFNA